MQTLHNCDFCNYKNQGNSCAIDQITNAYATNECSKFKLGKCFSCVINEQEDKSLCIKDLWPSGCGNYKNAK